MDQLQSLMRSKKTYTFLLLLSAFSLFSQEKQPKKIYTRIVIGPALGFYKNNPVHTADTRSKSSFYIGVYEDIKMYKDFSFLPGLEYTFHGLSFNSYYITPGAQNLYDKHFYYNYTLRMQEARLNVLFRQVIGLETRNSITGYLEYGYVLRYLFKSQLNVNSNVTGAEMFSGKPDIAFEHPIIFNNMASALKLTVGMQHNFFKTHRAWFFEAGFMYSLSRFTMKNSFVPAALYIDGSFLQLGLGIKF
jgi:hypothetical protein